MEYTKSLCIDKLDLIQQMIMNNILEPNEIEKIWCILNDASYDIDEYIDKNKILENGRTTTIDREILEKLQTKLWLREQIIEKQRRKIALLEKKLNEKRQWWRFWK